MVGLNICRRSVSVCECTLAFIQKSEVPPPTEMEKSFSLKWSVWPSKTNFFFGWGWQSKKKKKTIQQAVHKMFQSHCRRKSHSGFDLISPNWESKTDKTDSDKGKKLKKKWQWKFPNQILPLREWNGITKYSQTTIARSLGRSSH